MAGFDLSKMSEEDRASIERLQQASRLRQLERLRATAAAVPVTVLVSGGPPALLLLLLGSVPVELLAASATPGLALGYAIYNKLGPDDRGPIA